MRYPGFLANTGDQGPIIEIVIEIQDDQRAISFQFFQEIEDIFFERLQIVDGVIEQDDVIGTIPRFSSG